MIVIVVIIVIITRYVKDCYYGHLMSVSVTTAMFTAKLLLLFNLETL